VLSISFKEQYELSMWVLISPSGTVMSVLATDQLIILLQVGSSHRPRLFDSQLVHFLSSGISRVEIYLNQSLWKK
jgi:hypothetical protein